MDDEKRGQRNSVDAVRKGDISPYTALRWVSTLFKGAAVFLAVAVVAEFIAGIRAEGWAAMPILLGEIARTAVFGVVLWGGGDLVRLFIQLADDIRVERILLTRLVHRTRPVSLSEREYGGYGPVGEARSRPPEFGPDEAAAD